MTVEDVFEHCLIPRGRQPRRLSAAPARRLAVLTCMDARVDPLGELGLVLGDAVILRNAGARATDDALRSLALATHLLDVRAVAVMQHTACALASTDEAAVTERLSAAGRSPLERGWLAMPDPDASLREDVARIGSSPLLPPDTLVEGWRLDIETGTVERIIGH